MVGHHGVVVCWIGSHMGWVLEGSERTKRNLFAFFLAFRGFVRSATVGRLHHHHHFSGVDAAHDV
jgi:hypothetical protein